MVLPQIFNTEIALGAWKKQEIQEKESFRINILAAWNSKVNSQAFLPRLFSFTFYSTIPWNGMHWDSEVEKIHQFLMRPQVFCRHRFTHLGLNIQPSKREVTARKYEKKITTGIHHCNSFHSLFLCKPFGKPQVIIHQAFSNSRTKTLFRFLIFNESFQCHLIKTLL